jgi:hypothetical protein
MAPIGRAGQLQLPRGTGKRRQSTRISLPRDEALEDYVDPSGPEASPDAGADAQTGWSVDSTA